MWGTSFQKWTNKILQQWRILFFGSVTGKNTRRKAKPHRQTAGGVLRGFQKSRKLGEML